MPKYILAVNPGSTSTKMALFADEMLVTQKTVRHTPEEFAGCESIFDQKDIRTAYLVDFINDQGLTLESLSAVVGRGGFVKPIDSGTYLINEHLIQDLTSGFAGTHASCLGGIIANELGQRCGIPAYIVDPIVVDEMEPVAKISGLPGIERKSIFHALNTKAVTRSIADTLGMRYEDGRFVVAHMGGGITVGAHRYGRVIDVSDALSGEGAFTPERSGSLPLKPVVEMCFSGEYTKAEMMKLITGQGGMQAYLGTTDMQQAEKMIKAGDEYAALIVDAMAWQVAKDIGSMAAALDGQVNAIVLTGGLAFSNRFTGAIKYKVDKIAPVITHPGEDEMGALARGAYSVLTGKEQALEY